MDNLSSSLIVYLNILPLLINVCIYNGKIFHVFYSLFISHWLKLPKLLSHWFFFFDGFIFIQYPVPKLPIIKLQRKHPFQQQIKTDFSSSYLTHIFLLAGFHFIYFLWEEFYFYLFFLLIKTESLHCRCLEWHGCLEKLLWTPSRNVPLLHQHHHKNEVRKQVESSPSLHSF